MSSSKTVSAAWLIAMVATLGSLFFSEVMKLPPCVLCWYQRIGMYPLVIILAVGLLRDDRYVHAYALPFALSGFGVSVYHNLLYYRIIPETLAPCVQGISCTSHQIEWFGFITIPLLALLSFATLAFLLLYDFKRKVSYEAK